MISKKKKQERGVSFCRIFSDLYSGLSFRNLFSTPLSTALIIIRSRFKKEVVTEKVRGRRLVCNTCPFNSKNSESIPWNKKAIIKLSDFYSWICGTLDQDNLGNCLACSSCSIYYKTMEDLEICPKNKWKQ
jgi:hypothetical protein